MSGNCDGFCLTTLEMLATSNNLSDFVTKEEYQNIVQNQIQNTLTTINKTQQTISASIKRLRELDERLSGDVAGLTKKEQLDLSRERDKLERSLGGIKEMGGTPDMLFIIDTNKESIAVLEARKRGIPIAAILDSNSDPDGIDFPIPGNDDAIRAVSLYCDLVAGAVLDGIRAEIAASGGDVGALDEPPVEEVPAAEPAAGAEASPAE